MISPSDELWLARMLEAIQRARDYARRGKNEFLENEDTQQLVVHNLEHVVECADHLSQSFKKSHPGVRWKSLSEVRTYLIHQYAEVSPQVVWEFLRDELPSLERKLLNIRLRPGSR